MQNRLIHYQSFHLSPRSKYTIRTKPNTHDDTNINTSNIFLLVYFHLQDKEHQLEFSGKLYNLPAKQMTTVSHSFQNELNRIFNIKFYLMDSHLQKIFLNVCRITRIIEPKIYITHRLGKTIF